MLPFSDSLNWLDGETQGNDSTETGTRRIRPGLGSGMHWEEGKNLRVLHVRLFCALPPPGEEKIVQLHKHNQNGKMLWQGANVMAGEGGGGEDAGLKSRFHIGGMKFILACAKRTLITPMWLNLGLGEDISFGAVLSFPYLLQLAVAQLIVSVAETKLSSHRFSNGKG